MFNRADNYPTLSARHAELHAELYSQRCISLAKKWLHMHATSHIPHIPHACLTKVECRWLSLNGFGMVERKFLPGHARVNAFEAFFNDLLTKLAAILFIPAPEDPARRQNCGENSKIKG